MSKIECRDWPTPDEINDGLDCELDCEPLDAVSEIMAHFIDTFRQLKSTQNELSH